MLVTGASGSSPLTRGKLKALALDEEYTRLIPAHAGKTVLNVSKAVLTEAHPRSRGENFRDTLMPALWSGSSPLTRGKLCPRLSIPRLDGLIPAHAGKTAGPLRAPTRPEAHPRSRGENNLLALHAQGLEGSSPLTRGKLSVSMRTRILLRLIPAHAGKTHLSAREVSRDIGSSPLTRGKRDRRIVSSPLPGLIPAHAGKTQWRSGSLQGRPAHPRSRGENLDVQPHSRPPAGSSPLTRGKLSGEAAQHRVMRLIPAHAGKTW